MNDAEQIKTQQLKQGRLVATENFPKNVVIDTISFCNLKCSMCAHKDMSRKRGKMSMELFKKIIDEIADVDNNTRVWLVFFGEALLLKKTTLFQMIKYAKEKNLTDVVLNSNGNLLDENTAKRLIESGLDIIYIGIDAFTPDTYKKIRIGGNYHTVVNNVINLINLEKDLRLNKPKVCVQFIEMEINKKEVGDFIDFWKNHGAIVKIRPMASWAGLVNALNLRIPMKERWPCYWIMQTMAITDTGKVVLCGVDVDARHVAGDITRQTIKEVWRGKLKELRDLHKNNQFDLLPYPCKDCKDWQAARAEYYSSEC
jgi:radical SAM protein with 4Fe4S-binding SPASM domain